MKLCKLVAAAGVAVVLAGPALAQERISIGTGGTGGLFYVIGAGMAEVLNNHMADTTARAEVTGASVENIRRVAADQMTFGFSSSSTLYEVSVGEGPFEEAFLNNSTPRNPPPISKTPDTLPPKLGTL